MNSEKQVKFRGSCGLDITTFNDEKTGRVYSATGCPNPRVTEGMSAQSLRTACVSCEAEHFAAGADLVSAGCIVPPPVSVAAEAVEATPELAVTEPASVVATVPVQPAEAPMVPLQQPPPLPTMPPPVVDYVPMPIENAATQPVAVSVAAQPSVHSAPPGLPTYLPPPGAPQPVPEAPQPVAAVQPVVTPPQTMQLIPPVGDVIGALPTIVAIPPVAAASPAPALPVGMLPPGAVVTQPPVPVVCTPAAAVADLPPVAPPPPVVAGSMSSPVAEVAPHTLPSAAVGTFLPGMNLGGLDDQNGVDIDALLEGIDGVDGGPSSGGLSWHNLADAESCWRKAYFTMVRGLRKKVVSPALALGSLVHACFELHYRSGGQRTFEPCDVVAAAGAVDIAADARRFVYAQVQKYGAEEAATWDIRGVENQGTMFLPPTKINGKTVHIPITCRHDLVTAVRTAGAPCTPPGQPAAGGCYIVDHKTSRALSYDLTKGYGMDGQFLMNALIYINAEAEEMGPLLGVIVSIIAKHKTMSDKSMQRIYTTVDDESLKEFYNEEVIPYATETYRRLSDPEIRGDIMRWPKCHASCVGPYGPCFFFDICDSIPGTEESIISSLYVEQPERIKHVENFMQPSAEHKRTVGKTPEQLDASEQKKQMQRAAREELKAAVTELIKEAFKSYEQFSAAAHMSLGKKADVKSSLAAELQKAWESGTRFALPLSDDEGDVVNYTITAKGLTWASHGKRGSWTFKSLATVLSSDWWNPASHQPEAVVEDIDSRQHQPG